MPSALRNMYKGVCATWKDGYSWDRRPRSRKEGCHWTSKVWSLLASDWKMAVPWLTIIFRKSALSSWWYADLVKPSLTIEMDSSDTMIMSRQSSGMKKAFQQRFIFSVKQDEDGRTLADYKIQEKSTLRFVLQSLWDCHSGWNYNDNNNDENIGSPFSFCVKDTSIHPKAVVGMELHPSERSGRSMVYKRYRLLSDEPNTPWAIFFSWMYLL